MSEILRRIEDYNITPVEQLGQHFLIDDEVLDFIGEQVIPGSNVFEVGSGIGSLTERLAQRASKVFGLEIDGRFREVLAEVSSRNPNVEIFFQDALQFDYKDFIKSKRDKKERKNSDWQVIANLPFHITEPFLRAIVGLPLDDIILTIGDTSADSLLSQSPQSLSFTKTSMIALAYYEVQKIRDLSKAVFYPPPRTDSAIVLLVPTDLREQFSPARQVIRYLLETENRMTIEQAIQQAMQFQKNQSSAKFTDKRRTHRYDRRNIRRQLSRELYSKSEDRNQSKRPDIKLPADIQKLRFSKLDNSQLRGLI